MLPGYLKNLRKSFNVEDKGIFPYKLVNEFNLDYEGKVPEYNYFDGIFPFQYEEYFELYKYSPWNLRRETEIYCRQDCRVLYKVLLELFKEHFLNTKVNGSLYVSLPSLSVANYRARFMSNNANIPNIKGEVFHFIK